MVVVEGRETKQWRWGAGNIYTGGSARLLRRGAARALGNRVWRVGV